MIGVLSGRRPGIVLSMVVGVRNCTGVDSSRTSRGLESLTRTTSRAENLRSSGCRNTNLYSSVIEMRNIFVVVHIRKALRDIVRAWWSTPVHGTPRKLVRRLFTLDSETEAVQNMLYTDFSLLCTPYFIGSIIPQYPKLHTPLPRSRTRRKQRH